MELVDLAACGDFEGVKNALGDSSTSIENINSIDKDGRSAYHYACLNDDVKLLQLLLKDDRVKVDLKTPNGDTGLHLASLYASLGAMEMLLGDIRGNQLLNAKNKYGETPLHLCAGSGDKGAAKAASLLLKAGASLLERDQWGRGPVDIARDNAENALTTVFNDFLDTQSSELRTKVAKITEEYKADQIQTIQPSAEVKEQKAKALLSGLGGALKGLKKVEVKEKKMFSNLEGKVTDKKAGAKDMRFQGKILSKLIDFPGDIDEIRAYLADPKVSAGGKDAYGLTALHKFASWNKVELIDMVLPKLSEEEINAQDPDGKTALHWACEMASVAALERLVKVPELDRSIKDKKGRTANDILNSGDGAVVERLKGILNG